MRKAPRRSADTDSMNTAAAEIRSAIRTVLASWAGLVAGERRVEVPVLDIPALTRFLLRNFEWLTCHPAAGDMADEIQGLVRTARGVAYPDNMRRIRIGSRPGSGCDGDVVALIRRHGDFLPSSIVCTTPSGHSWPITWWNRPARRQMRSREGRLRSLGEGI